MKIKQILIIGLLIIAIINLTSCNKNKQGDLTRTCLEDATQEKCQSPELVNYEELYREYQQMSITLEYTLEDNKWVMTYIENDKATYVRYLSVENDDNEAYLFDKSTDTLFSIEGNTKVKVDSGDDSLKTLVSNSGMGIISELPLYEGSKYEKIRTERICGFECSVYSFTYLDGESEKIHGEISICDENNLIISFNGETEYAGKSSNVSINTTRLITTNIDLDQYLNLETINRYDGIWPNNEEWSKVGLSNLKAPVETLIDMVYLEENSINVVFGGGDFEVFTELSKSVFDKGAKYRYDEETSTYVIATYDELITEFEYSYFYTGYTKVEDTYYSCVISLQYGMFNITVNKE